MVTALMEKTENFTVSLRKAKRQQILNQKRGRLLRPQDFLRGTNGPSQLNNINDN